MYGICKHLKQKFNNKLECKIDKNRIPFKDCKNCPYKEYKDKKCTIISKNCAKSNNNQIKNTVDNKCNKFKKTVKMKTKSNKLAKLERERFSLFTNNMSKCYLCPSTYKITKHEIFRGRNRQNSMRYGLVLPLCLKCHEKYQDDHNFNEEWHKKGRALFEKAYPKLDFLEVFGKNYK